jgi:ABC-2 type transport system ATP-binding protein
MTVGKPGPSREPVAAFDEVSKVYGPVRAVDGLSLDLHHGETVAFLGPNVPDR